MSGQSSGGASESSPHTGDPHIGRVLDGRYRIEDVLGSGGVGVVYLAEHIDLQRKVAIKILHEQLGELTELQMRFKREGQVLSALSHPNIVAINDFGIADKLPFLVMELLHGRTVADLIDDDGPPPPEIALHIARQMLRGLAYAHARGIIHRDLKASNVFLVALPESPYHVKLLDFGLAKIFSTEDGDDPLEDDTLTKAGTILGTPAYMSPEQASGSPVDERADVYSGAAVIFELLTGRYPFLGGTRAEMIRAHMVEPVPVIEEARPGLSVCPELQALVSKALDKDRQKRFTNAGAMLEALDALPTPAVQYDAQIARRMVFRDPSDEKVSNDDATLARAPSTQPPTLDGAAGAPKAPGKAATWRSPRAILLVAALLVVGALAAALVTFSGSGSNDRRRDVQDTGNGAGAVEKQAATRPPTGDDEASNPSAGQGGEPAGAQTPTELPVGQLAPVDPFFEVLPEPMRRYHVKVRAGQVLERRDRRMLMALQRASPSDPRPALILAHHFVDIGFFSDALARYEQAVEIDPACRGDGRMLRDLIRMAASPAVGDRAGGLIERTYARDALPEVEAAAARELDPDGLERLTRLRSRLLPP